MFDFLFGPEHFIFEPFLILPMLVYIIGSLLDWYTTKRLIIDKNLRYLEKGLPAPHKEQNIIYRWIIGTPDKSDEWKLLAYKLLAFLFMWWAGVPVVAWYGWGAAMLLVAANNKWNLIYKIKTKLGGK